MTAFANIDYEHWLQQQIAGDAAEGMAGRKLTAMECADFCRLFLADAVNGREGIAPFVQRQGLDMPESSVGWLPERLRLESVEWWTRKLRTKATREQEYTHIQRGDVRQYCSEDLLKATREKQARVADWLGRTELKQLETKQAISLKQVHDGSLSNMGIREKELTVRSKGVTEYYLEQGYRGLIVTTTAGASWHRLRTVIDSQGKKTKVLNPRYNGATPKQVQQMLNKQLSLVRTYLSNRDIKITGIRVAEPHADGCTHWHFVLWFKNGKEAKTAIQAFRRYFLFHEGPPEPGALKHRLKFDTVNPKKGDAVGYVLKYITKGISGEHIDDHVDGNGEKIAEGKEGAERTMAWARCWGIRQFQFLGAPPANIYREFRRVWCKAMGRGKSQQVTVPTFAQHQELQAYYKEKAVPDDMAELWYAANEGDYGRYIRAYYDAMNLPNFLEAQRQGQEFFKMMMTLAIYWQGVADASASDFALQAKASYVLAAQCQEQEFFKMMLTLSSSCQGAAITGARAIASASIFALQAYAEYADSLKKPKPQLLKHGFVDDLRLLADFYGDVQSVPDRVINKLESLNQYQEPKTLVYGVRVGETELKTRPFDGYYKRLWSLTTTAKPETPASVQERIEAYATIRAGDGIDNEYWGDVVAFSAAGGAFRKAEGRAASDLWQ